MSATDRLPEIPLEAMNAAQRDAKAEEIARQSMVVRQAERIDIECIVRGYITGSAWKEKPTTALRPSPAPWTS